MNPQRILYISGGILNWGGITSFMMNYYQRFDKEKLQIDFVVNGGKGERDDEIIGYGGKVYYIPTKKENLRANINGMKEIFNPDKYKLVHSHLEGMNGMVLGIAKKNGIPVRISHCHGIEHDTPSTIKKMVHTIVQKQIPRTATHKWACSEEAGTWLYGKGSTFEVIPNAINTKKYKFNEKIRSEKRREFGLGKRYVIGCVGMLHPLKNHKFLIELMPELIKKHPDLVLFFVGDGIEKDNLVKRAKDLGVKDNIYFAGHRDDVPQLLNIFDVIAFPSVSEGLPVSLIEEQANGLHCVVSNTLTREVDVTGQCEFIPLNTKLWVKSLSEKRERSTNSVSKIIESGYDIESAAKKLESKYLKLLQIFKK